MRTILAALTFLSMFAAASRIEADPARYPKRQVDGQTVDLTPLLDWWAQQKGDRPLQAWVHITGRVVGTNALGWTVVGNAEPTASAGKTNQATAAPAERLVRFVLKNPPLVDLVEFQRLTAQRQWLSQERTRLESAAADAKGRQEDLSQDGGMTGKMYTRLKNDEISQSQTAENDARDQLDGVEKQLREIGVRLADYPSSSEYQVDCFALRRGQQFQGVPVFDHGTILQPP